MNGNNDDGCNNDISTSNDRLGTNITANDNRRLISLGSVQLRPLIRFLVIVYILSFVMLIIVSIQGIVKGISTYNVDGANEKLNIAEIGWLLLLSINYAFLTILFVYILCTGHTLLYILATFVRRRRNNNDVHQQQLPIVEHQTDNDPTVASLNNNSNGAVDPTNPISPPWIASANGWTSWQWSGYIISTTSGFVIVIVGVVYYAITAQETPTLDNIVICICFGILTMAYIVNTWELVRVVTNRYYYYHGTTTTNHQHQPNNEQHSPDIEFVSTSKPTPQALLAPTIAINRNNDTCDGVPTIEHSLENKNGSMQRISPHDHLDWSIATSQSIGLFLWAFILLLLLYENVTTGNLVDRTSTGSNLFNCILLLFLSNWIIPLSVMSSF